MPDIAMCNNEKCPSKESCYRYTAIPSDWQSYDYSFAPKEGEGKCEYYWNNIEDYGKNK